MSSSIIKSDNGVTSGVTGIISSGGSDGTLLLQTTTSGGTATTAVTIDNSQVVTFANKQAVQNMPTGSVIQVVNSIYSTITSTTTSAQVATGLTASITPQFSTSKILILISHPLNLKPSTNYLDSVSFSLYKNGSLVTQWAGDCGYTNTAIYNYFSTSYTYLDSPATTSSTTYATYFGNGNGTPGVSGAGSVTVQAESSKSTITLMEIR